MGALIDLRDDLTRASTKITWFSQSKLFGADKHINRRGHCYAAHGVRRHTQLRSAHLNDRLLNYAYLL